MGERRDLKLGTLIYHSKSHPADKKIFPERGVFGVRWPLLEFYTPCKISAAARLTLETSNFVHGSAMRCLSLVMSESSLSGRGQGHVSNFYIVGLENFATVSRRYRWYTQLDHSWFVYNTHNTVEATRSRHGWVHMFTTHRSTLTLQLHNFDLFRTCRTSIFHTVAWQLTRFQLTRCIARSLGDSWASCCIFADLRANSRWRLPRKKTDIFTRRVGSIDVSFARKPWLKRQAGRLSAGFRAKKPSVAPTRPHKCFTQT